MKLIILLVLLACITILAIIAYRNNSPITDRYPVKGSAKRHQSIQSIRESNNIALLKEQAIDLVLNIDEQSIENERAAFKVQSLLILIIFLSSIMLVIMYFEIAARGKVAKN